MKTPVSLFCFWQGKPGFSIMCQGIHMMKVITSSQHVIYAASGKGFRKPCPPVAGR
jgi:hypothetical protein